MPDFFAPKPQLTAELVETAFRAVGAKLQQQGLAGEILVVGGAYMMLVANARAVTHDVDAYFMSDRAAMLRAATAVAHDLGLQETWLNDAVHIFLGRRPDRSSVISRYPGLTVYAPAAEYVFALKCLAARPGTPDAEDVAILGHQLGISTYVEALAVLERELPSALSTDRVRRALADVFPP